MRNLHWFFYICVAGLLVTAGAAITSLGGRGAVAQAQPQAYTLLWSVFDDHNPRTGGPYTLLDLVPQTDATVGSGGGYSIQPPTVENQPIVHPSPTLPSDTFSDQKVFLPMITR
jgi:hypothetical protein